VIFDVDAAVDRDAGLGVAHFYSSFSCPAASRGR
jgi:hypothetical protein